MLETTFFDILKEIIDDKERPEEVPDKLHCKLPLRFLNQIPIAIHKAILKLQSIEVECESLAHELNNEDIDLNESDEIELRIIILSRFHKSVFHVIESLSEDIVDVDESLYSPQLMGKMIMSSIKELDINVLFGVYDDDPEEDFAPYELVKTVDRTVN